MENGCLSDAVRRRALELLDQDGDLEEWATESPGDAPARRRTLNALRKRLLSPQRPWKPFRVEKRAERSQLDLPVGSVLRLGLPTDRYALLKLVGFLQVGHVSTALFRVLPWCSSRLPTADELQSISELWILLDGHHEFSILYDGRKKLTSLLEPIGITLASETPIDRSRWRAYGAAALPAIIAAALATEPLRPNWSLHAMI